MIDIVNWVYFLGLVEWSKKQIEIFAELFRKQVFTSDVDQNTVDECVKITHDQGKKVRSNPADFCIATDLAETDSS